LLCYKSGKIALNFGFARLDALLALAKAFFSSSVAVIEPVVGVFSSMKDNKPTKTPLMVHAGHHVSAGKVHDE
jgi:hypothetical protein